MRTIRSLLLGLFMMVFSGVSLAKVIETTHLVGFGEAKYAANFSHFDYVNPKAPKYGKVTFGELGSFDNFNAFASRGVAAADSSELYDPLLKKADDEIDSYYPLIAQKLRYSDDYLWMEVEINPHARFQDGTPITAQDVAFTFDKLMKQGVPQFRVYYKDIKSVRAIAKLTVRIEMDKPERDKLFSLVESLQVLPEHYWRDKDLSQPLLTPPVGSGAYRVSSYKMGQRVTYSLNDNYWAKDLPVNVGRNNFKQIQYDYYRDDTVMLEAFKTGDFDFRQESQARVWANSYTGINFDKGYIVKEQIPHTSPAPTQGFVFNTQRTIFHDRRVREALNYAMDFQWMNHRLFYDQYTRTRSYFQSTDYEAKGLPSQAELAILKPFKHQVPKRVFTEEYQPPVTDGSGYIRPQMRKAFALLKQAGWIVKQGRLVNAQTGQPFEFSLMLSSPSLEKVAIQLQRNLKKLGIKIHIRMVDSTQYMKRLRDRDFDMVVSSYAPNPYPSADLLFVWNSHYIDSTYNTAGVSDPVVDNLTEQIARNQAHPQKLLALGRALDRVLQWNFYIIPHWYLAQYRVAMWDKFERPAITPKYSLALDTWWVSKQKAQRLPAKRR
ncbi:ABC transporter substrate-binding protein [Vibrio sp. CAIM 722]|uniref:ABC transporter substrate-binding protein n=1 Tax=Vibrio eleionomae TaxID=2653505 RepID=A0A7X4RWE3_9VIBR|nr:extracellular solute-binding protein [Vibrio eleionomae]MZI95242.1 ABC transporter substrate-binding protein [Vibrio eleionomae]